MSITREIFQNLKLVNTLRVEPTSFLGSLSYPSRENLRTGRRGLWERGYGQSLTLSSWVRRRKWGSVWITSSLWGRRSANVWTRQSCFFPFFFLFFFHLEHPFIDKPVVINEPAVPSTWLLGLGGKLYPSNMSRMLKKDLTRFMQGLSRVRQNRASERKVLLEAWLANCEFINVQPE